MGNIFYWVGLVFTLGSAALFWLGVFLVLAGRA